MTSNVLILSEAPLITRMGIALQFERINWLRCWLHSNPELEHLQRDVSLAGIGQFLGWHRGRIAHDQRLHLAGIVVRFGVTHGDI